MPAEIAANIPEEGSIVPIPVDTELHVPPVVLLLKSLEDPAHAIAVPVIAAGNALTVTGFVAMHPVGNS